MSKDDGGDSPRRAFAPLTAASGRLYDRASADAIDGEELDDDEMLLSPVERRRDPHEGAARDVETAQAVKGLFGRDAIYVMAWTAQLGLAALVTPVSTRLLGTANFGAVAAATAVMQLLVAVGSMQLQNAVQRQYAQPGGERGARRLITLTMLIAGLTFAVAYATGPEWSKLLGKSVGGFGGPIHLAVIWAALTAITWAGLGLLRSRDQLVWFGAASVLQSVGASVLALLLVAFVHASATEWLLGMTIGQAAAAIVVLAVTRPLPIRRRDTELVATALRYSAGLMSAAVAAFVFDAIDRLIITHDLGSIQAGRYAVARNIGAIPLLVLGVLGTAWLPRFFALSGNEVRAAVIGRSRDTIFTLLIPMIVAVGAGAPLLLTIWVPGSFDPHGLWLIVTTITATALPVVGVMTATWTLMLTDRTFPIAICTGFGAVANITLNILLIPPLKIEGSAIATVASYVLLYMLLARAARGQLKVALPPARLVVGCLVAVGAAIGLSQAPTGSVMIVVREVVTLACLLLFASVLADVVSPLRYPRLTRLVGVIERGYPRPAAPAPSVIIDEYVPAPSSRPVEVAAQAPWGVTLALSGLFVGALALFGLGYIVDAAALRLVGAFGVVYFGVGAAPVQLASRAGLIVRLGVAGVVGLSLLMLGGALMALVPVWHPVVLAVLLVVAAAALHAIACRRALVGVRLVELRDALPQRLTLNPSVACSVVGTLLWVVTAVAQGHIVPGVGGFLTHISVLWYVGLVLLLAAIALARDGSEWHAAFALTSLMAALTATPALVYGMPRSQSAVKHVELIGQILSTHHLNRANGIYEAYSAFFGGIAWICDLARVHDSLGLAAWWPFAIGMARLAELRFFFGRLVRARYRIWAAMTLVVLIDSLGTDYFSPQSVGFVIGLGVYALALGRESPGFSMRARVELVVLAGCALAATHELSPYIVGGVLVVLAASRAARPWFVAAGCLVPAAAWALLNHHVLAGFVNFSDLGNLSNFVPPKTVATPGLSRLAIVGDASHALLAGILVLVVLACIGFARTIRRRPSWGFFISAGVGIFFIVINPYGNEGIFRAALFGIPWLAVLAIVALRTNPPRWISGLFAIVSVGLLAAFLVSSFGLDNAGVVRASDVSAFRIYERRALYTGNLLNLTYGDIPSTVASVNATNHLLTWSKLVPKATLTAVPTAADARLLARTYVRYAAANTGAPAGQLYALWSPAGAAYGVDYGLETLPHALEWRSVLAASPYWHTVYAGGGSYLFQVVTPAPAPAPAVALAPGRI